jgi:hypothetical protein
LCHLSSQLSLSSINELLEKGLERRIEIAFFQKKSEKIAEIFPRYFVIETLLAKFPWEGPPEPWVFQNDIMQRFNQKVTPRV